MFKSAKKRGFTFTELLVSIGIVAVIAGGVIITMSRGASNVHRGSFNATASNQAAWIVTLIRRDIARSQADKITFKPDSGKKWTGSGQFALETSSGEKIKYSIEKRGSGRAFCRADANGRQTFLASEYLSEMSVEDIGNCFRIDLLLKDPGKQAVDFSWSAQIYPPLPVGADRFWKPISATK
ncbi:MAG: type II secretion system protein [Candidatus Rifleibacteriota bacterium]